MSDNKAIARRLVAILTMSKLCKRYAGFYIRRTVRNVPVSHHVEVDVEPQA